MSLLVLLLVYVGVVSGGRLLLRRIRQHRDVFLYLQGSAQITAIGLGLVGLLTVFLLLITLYLGYQHFAGAGAGTVSGGAQGLPMVWWGVVGFSLTLTLLFLLLHYNDSDWVQLGVFALVALLFLIVAWVAYELDTPYTGLVTIPLPDLAP
jgi:hypothetical protein